MWGQARYLVPLWMTSSIRFSRVVLEGREGFDAQAARLASGDVLLRVPHNTTTHMCRAEVEHALGRNYGYSIHSHDPATVFWLAAKHVKKWSPNDRLWFNEEYQDNNVSTLFVGGYNKGAHPLPPELRDYVLKNAEFPEPVAHFADYEFTWKLIDLAQRTGVIWSKHGFITKYAMLGPDHLEEASAEALAIQAEAKASRLERLPTPRKA